jgi:hypothetical protein
MREPIEAMAIMCIGDMTGSQLVCKTTEVRQLESEYNEALRLRGEAVDKYSELSDKYCRLTEQNIELKEQIRKMRCCGNCGVKINGKCALHAEELRNGEHCSKWEFFNG